MESIQSESTYEGKSFISVSVSNAKLRKAVFTRCLFSRCNFSSTMLDSCLFEDCKFEGCNFNVAKPINCKFADCKFKSCRLTGIDWSVVRKELGLAVDFDDCDLSYSSYYKIDLSGRSFKKCVIKDSDFTESVLRKCSFEYSDLLSTRFIKCDLSDADFRLAQNYLFDLRDNKCKGAKFSMAGAVHLLTPFGVVVE